MITPDGCCVIHRPAITLLPYAQEAEYNHAQVFYSLSMEAGNRLLIAIEIQQI